MPRRSLMFRVLAASATFSVGALLVGALTFGTEAGAEKPQPAPAPTKVASLTAETNAPPAKVEAQKAEEAEPVKPKPKSHAKKFLPVHSFGGY